MFDANNHPDIHEYIDLHKEVYGTKRGACCHESEEEFLKALKYLREYTSDPDYIEERRRELEEWRAEIAQRELEDKEEWKWQVWCGNPNWLSKEEQKENELALEYEAIEMSLMGL